MKRLVDFKKFNENIEDKVHVEPKALKYEKGEDGYSVLVKQGDMKLWIDVDIVDNDVRADWNQYIFNTEDSNDMEIKKFQEDPNNFEDFTSVAIQHLEQENEIKQNDDGAWEVVE